MHVYSIKCSSVNAWMLVFRLVDVRIYYHVHNYLYEFIDMFNCMYVRINACIDTCVCVCECAGACTYLDLYSAVVGRYFLRVRSYLGMNLSLAVRLDIVRINTMLLSQTLWLLFNFYGNHFTKLWTGSSGN